MDTFEPKPLLDRDINLVKALANGRRRVAVHAEEVQRLEAIFDQLPKPYAEVITLAKIVGLTHEEIAAEMGKSVTASRMLLHRALAKLNSGRLRPDCLPGK